MYFGEQRQDSFAVPDGWGSREPRPRVLAAFSVDKYFLWGQKGPHQKNLLGKIYDELGCQAD